MDKGYFKLIKSARLINGTGAPVLERGAVLVQGDQIMAVGTEEAVTPPEGAEVQDFEYGDSTLLPGLIDCHVHLNGIGDGRSGDELVQLPDEILTLQSGRNARTHLYSGVTTVRDCGAKNRTTLMLRKAMEMGVTPGPRLVLAGRPMAIIGGHLSYFGIEVTGETECRAAVRQLVKEEADFIKITVTGGSTGTSVRLKPSFTLEELQAICDEAHKFGIHTVAHSTNSHGTINALDAGVDTILHAIHLEPDGSYVYRPDITERIAKQGVFVNPTLFQGLARLKMIEHQQNAEGLTEEEQNEYNSLMESQNVRLKHVERMRSEGVRLVCGSDSSWAYYPMGNFQGEIETHVRVGMTPLEAIVSATSDSARSCRIDDKVGTLEPGKKADLLVVGGDPSKDITDLRKIKDVFLEGDLVDRGNYV